MKLEKVYKKIDKNSMLKDEIERKIYKKTRQAVMGQASVPRPNKKTQAHVYFFFFASRANDESNQY
jgi:hypothetical protein